MPSSPEIDLAIVGSGSITAPAGHGKTEVIAASVAAHPELRFLVLTHTNAGVSSLKRRVARCGGAAGAHIETISALALRLVRAFPTGVRWTEDEAHIDYRSALAGARAILSRRTILRAFADSYDRLIVDEYQDCTRAHDALITLLASAIPTVVLGDPLQAIFNIDKNDPLVGWNEVLTRFPEKGNLPIPHRWASANCALGDWLKSIRAPLLAGLIPIRLDPSIVTVRRLDRPAHQGSLFPVLNTAESTAIIIGNSARSQTIPAIAKAHSKIGVREHEAAQHDEVASLCSSLLQATDDASRITLTTSFLANAMTGVARVPGLRTVTDNLQKTGTVGRSKAPFANAVNAYLNAPIPASLTEIINVIAAEPSCCIFRPEQLSILSRALLSTRSDWAPLPNIARQLIDHAAHVRHLRSQRQEVGSTLRVKGLEYDHVVLLDPADVPSAEHLYVALSRAMRRVTVALSPDAELGRWLTS